MGIDYYAILNVSRDCTLHEIQLAYRKLAILTHPNHKPYPQYPIDGSMNNVNVPNFIADIIPTCITWELVNEAYDVLSDELKRQVYDLYGEEGLKSGVPAPNGYIQPYAYHGDYMKTYQDVFGTYSPYGDLIDAITNPPPLYSSTAAAAESNGLRAGVKHKDKPIHKLIGLDLKEIFFGTIKQIKLSRMEFLNGECSKTVVRDRIFTIQLPAGIQSGSEFCFAEEGDQGPTKIPADIIFTIIDKPHAVYTRHGNNLHMIYKINLELALCGFVLTIVTIDDRKLNVAITDVVSPNYRKVIEQEGLPFENDGSRKGDLIISFEIEFPSKISRSNKLELTKIFTEMYEKN